MTPSIRCAICVVLSVLLTGSVEARTVAVVVGINQYQSPSISGLRAAVSDAEGFAEALELHVGCEPQDVVLLTSATDRLDRRPTLGSIVKMLEWGGNITGPDDTFIFYFAGHGITRWGESYLLPMDADTTSAAVAAATAMPLDLVQKLLGEIKCRHQIVIMDCCRNEPELARGEEDNALTSAMVRDIEVVARAGHEQAGAQSSWVLFSCSAGERAYERPDGRNGVFTYFLIEGLAGAAAREGQVTVADLCAYVEEHVPPCFEREPGFPPGASQRPWHRSEGTGSVVLARVPAEVQTGDIISHLGNTGPAFETGMTPVSLGWGADSAAYPNRFVVNPIDGAEMVWVPAGRYWNGVGFEAALARLWEETGWSEEWWTWSFQLEFKGCPVELSEGYWIYRHEVTIGQYGEFLAATGYSPHELWPEFEAHTLLPVNLVTWYDATAYSRWAGGCLPTEAQWECAACGPEQCRFPWGDQWDSTRCCSAEYWAQRPLRDIAAHLSWLRELGFDPEHMDQWRSTQALIAAKYMKPVGSFPSDQSWCGALDMAGNVAEWCANRIYFYSDFGGGGAVDPAGPTSGDARMVRGGSWLAPGFECRTTHREAMGFPGVRAAGWGFRSIRRYH